MSSWVLFCLLFQDDHNFLYLSENLRVPKNLYERMAEVTDYKKYTSALLMILFDRETLATHSVQGRRNTVNGEDSQKPQLPPEILRSIIGKKTSQRWFFLNTAGESYWITATLPLSDHVSSKFGVDHSQIKTAIRTKLNNEDKLLKKRLGLGKVEHKSVTDESFGHDF